MIKRRRRATILPCPSQENVNCVDIFEVAKECSSFELLGRLNGGTMTHVILKITTFALKGALLGFVLGLGGAVFGTIVGHSFETIWASGMPLAMAFLGAMTFSILSGVGMHKGFRN